MIVVDANVLIYATNQESTQHPAARTWLDSMLLGRESVGFSWTVLPAYIRLTTNPRVFTNPLTSAEAIEQVERWLDTPAATVLHPTARHTGLLAGLLAQESTAGNLVNDAHIAALALEHGGRVASFDRDFERFEGVRCEVPAVLPI